MGEEDSAAELQCSLCNEWSPGVCFMAKQARRPQTKRKCEACVCSFDAQPGNSYWTAYHASHPEMQQGTSEASHHAAAVRAAAQMAAVTAQHVRHIAAAQKAAVTE